MPVRIIARSTLRTFWERPGRRDARPPLDAWYREVRRAAWRNAADIQRAFPRVSLLNDNRVCFNIGGNKYRLIVRVMYTRQAVYIRFIGTHAEYDEIDANTV